MTKNTSYIILGVIILVSCNSAATKTANVDTTTKIIKLTDSSRKAVVNALEDIVNSNATEGNTTISGRFVSQKKFSTGEFYIFIKVGDSTIRLINLTPLKDDEIAKLKKEGNNITVMYNDIDRKIKYLAEVFEPEK